MPDVLTRPNMRSDMMLSKNAREFFARRMRTDVRAPRKDGRLRFDLAEGLFTRPGAVLSMLPDRRAVRLKRSLADFLRLRPENIAVAAGADEIIEMIPRMYLDQDDRAIVVGPTFGRLLSSNVKSGARPVTYRLRPESDFDLTSADAERITVRRKNTGAKIIWLCSPNNPTGKVIPLPVIGKIAEENPKTLVMIDEAYQEYHSLQADESAASLIARHDNIIVLRTFSKAFCLAGARIGYAVACERLAGQMEGFRTMYAPSSPAQEAALEALSPSGLSALKKLKVKIERERHELYAFLRKRPRIKAVPGSRANFIFLRHDKKDIFRELHKNGVLVSDWRNSPGVEKLGYVRLSIRPQPYLARLKKALTIIG